MASKKIMLKDVKPINIGTKPRIGCGEKIKTKAKPKPAAKKMRH